MMAQYRSEAFSRPALLRVRPGTQMRLFQRQIGRYDVSRISISLPIVALLYLFGS